jgi:multidrug efflux pump subunit AcrB
LVVVSTVPAVIASVVLALWLTRTTLNIQSFMGAIMASSGGDECDPARDVRRRSRLAGVTSADSAVEARKALRRFMTSLAMVTGMIPMALGLGAANKPRHWVGLLADSRRRPWRR